MKTILTILMLAALVSCSPYQQLMIVPAKRNNILKDSCDLALVSRLRYALDTVSYDQTPVQSRLLEELIQESECEYYAHLFYPPRDDSSMWFLTIRPAMVGKEEIILGNLYTMYPGQDSVFVFHRRIKEYSQNKAFESGKYMGFTYFIENDSTAIIKTGISIY